jgi:hypothetical protein
MTERAIPILPCRSIVVFYALPIVFLSGLRRCRSLLLARSFHSSYPYGDARRVVRWTSPWRI